MTTNVYIYYPYPVFCWIKYKKFNKLHHHPYKKLISNFPQTSSFSPLKLFSLNKPWVLQKQIDPDRYITMMSFLPADCYFPRKFLTAPFPNKKPEVL